MAIRFKSMEGRIRMDLLYRLRWNILADPKDVTIAFGSRGEETVTPFFSHASADEDLAVPSLSRIEVPIAECEDKRGNDRSPDPFRYQPPTPLVINNEDGQPITLRQFVTEVHAYLNQNMDEIKKVKGDLYGVVTRLEDGTEQRTSTYGRPYLPENVGLFFKRVYANAPVDNEDQVRISVSVFANGELGRSLDQLWASNLVHADRYEMNRQNPVQATPTVIPLFGPPIYGTPGT